MKSYSIVAVVMGMVALVVLGVSFAAAPGWMQGLLLAFGMFRVSQAMLQRSDTTMYAEQTNKETKTNETHT